MKKWFFLLACTLVLFSTCNKDDDDVADGEQLLNYDGDNSTGPILEAGFYEAAVRFPVTIMSNYEGWTLNEVRWFMGARPASCIIKIYKTATNASLSPGELLYEADVSNQIDNSPQWYTHNIAGNIVADGDDVWVSIALEHTNTQQSIGCDAGPRQSNGDWIVEDSVTDWESYQQRTGSESINWNIRLVVAEQ